MLAVQISFNDLQEKIRHNKELEALTAEQNRISAGELDVHKGQLDVAKGQLEVSKGQLAVSEGSLQNDIRRVNEMIRNNKVMESQGWRKLEIQQDELNERIRSNMANEDIAWYNAESGRISANANVIGANAAMKQAETAQDRLGFEKFQWTTIGYDQQKANLGLTQQQTKTSKAQMNAYTSQTAKNLADATLAPTNTIINGFGSIINSVTGFGRMLGGK